MGTKSEKLFLALGPLMSASVALAQTNYNFTNTQANTFTNGYVLSGTLSTNASNAPSGANLSISTNGGAPLTFTSVNTWGTYTRTLCGVSTTFQEYQFGTGAAPTLYLDVMSTRTDAALAGQRGGVRTSLRIASGSYDLAAACDPPGGIADAAQASRHPRMTRNAAIVAQANASALPIASNVSMANAVPRLINTISSNLKQFNNRFGLNAISKRLQEKAAQKRQREKAAQDLKRYQEARAQAEAIMARFQQRYPEMKLEKGSLSYRTMVESATASLMSSRWNKENPNATPEQRQEAARGFRTLARNLGKNSGDDEPSGLTPELLAELDEGPIDFWVQPFASTGEQKERDNVSPFETQAYGITIGGDRKISDKWTVGGGLMLGTSTVKSSWTHAPNSTDTNMYQLLAYGQYAIDQDTHFQISGSLGLNENRNSRLAPNDSVASSKYDSTVVGLGLGLSRNFSLDESTSFTPSIGVNFSWQENARMVESGAGNWNVTTHKHSTRQDSLNLGAQLNREINDNWSVNAKAGATYAFYNPELTVVSSYAGAPTVTFTSTGSGSSPWTRTLGLGAKYTNSKGSELNIGYDAMIRSGFVNHSASVKFKVPF